MDAKSTQSSDSSFSVMNVAGPFREPREAAFSYDYSVIRSHWPTTHAVRVKVSIADELDYFRQAVLGITGGTPGQQLRLTQILTRKIADQKLHLGNLAGLFNERLDVIMGPFSGDLVYLFPKLESWMKDIQPTLRQEITDQVKL